MRRLAALGVLTLVLAAPPLAARQGFQRAAELVQQARYPEALEAARAEADPLGRARAELYVRHQAGDLHGALRAGLAGLGRSPEDAWLLEQSAYVAASLRQGSVAADLGARLASAAQALPDAERERYAARAEALAAEAADLLRHERARVDALAAARRTVLVVAGLALALLAWLALGGAGRTGP